MKHPILYHNFLFAFGWMYYLMLPLIMVIFRFFYDYPGMHLVYAYYNEDYILGYLLYVIILLFSFWAGSLTPLKYLKKKEKEKLITNKVISNRDLLFYSLPLFVYAQYVIIQNLSSLFKGYLIDYDEKLMGTISTINTLFLFFYLYCWNKINHNNKIRIFFLIVIFELSVVLLSLGSRMYVLLPFITIFVFLLDKKKISLKKTFMTIVLVGVFFCLVGIWRLGEITELDKIFYIGVAEPMFTWISTASIFYNGELPIIAFPSNFLTSFYNFIPTVIFPDKQELMIPINLNFDSPLGATSVLVSLISNFGIIGSFAAIYFLGFFFTYIRVNKTSFFFKCYYYCICGIIPFQLFRDSMPIVNKVLFFNYLLFPFIILIIEVILSFKYKKNAINN